MKKSFLLAAAIVAIVCSLAAPAQAQFSKTLKNAGKSVGKAAESAGTDIAVRKVSVKLIEFMDKNNTVLSEENSYAKRLARLSADFQSVKGTAINYKVYESEEANIIAIADGSIRVYSGMMDLFSSDEELQSILLIQVGHLMNNDVHEALLDVASEDNAAQAGSAQLEKMLSFSGDKLGSVVNELLQVPYSFDQSTKADTYAYNLLIDNGKSSEGLFLALATLADLEKADKQVEESEEGEFSAAVKYTRVNSDNGDRVELLLEKLK
ncbi:MAG: M48 family metalloprotease [Mangrovibacterium sp.]